MAGADDLGRQRSRLMRGVLLSLPAAAAIWIVVFVFVPPLAAGAETAGRLAFAFRCSAVAVLLCLVAGTEAVSHERLFSSAIDPLSGHTSRRLEVHLRYLGNTLEQSVIFVVGLVGLATFCHDGGELRAVLAATIVWIVARWAFWIGYLAGPSHRGVGIVGLFQSLVILLYVAARFGYETAGVAGAFVPLAAFGLIEAALVRTSRSG